MVRLSLWYRGRVGAGSLRVGSDGGGKKPQHRIISVFLAERGHAVLGRLLSQNDHAHNPANMRRQSGHRKPLVFPPPYGCTMSAALLALPSVVSVFIASAASPSPCRSPVIGW